MVCPHCKSDTKLRAHSRFVYERQDFDVAGHDLEVVLGSCSQCRAPVILLRRGTSVDMDGMIEMSVVDSEEVLYPK